MKKEATATYKKISFLLLFSAMIFINACRKTDVSQQNTTAAKSETEQHFFTSHDTADLAINAVQRFVRQQNERYHFIESLVSRIGIPYWNQSLVFNSKNARTMQAGNLLVGQGGLIAYVPFVRDKDQYVNALLIIKMNVTDTSFKMVYDKLYASNGFNDVPDTAWNAKNIFHLFAIFDNKAFQQKNFLITDGRLLNYNKTDTILASIKPGTNGSRTTNGLDLFDKVCFTFSYAVADRKMKTTSMAGEQTICTYIQDWGGGGGSSGGGSGGTGGDTGGGGSSGGWGDPCVAEAAERMDGTAGCEATPGWKSATTTLPLVTTDVILKNLHNPCLLSVVNNINDASFKNQVIKFFLDTYVGTNQKANLVFTENSSLVNSDGTPRAANSRPSQGTWTIELNPSYSSNASNEFWGSVIIHELVHSFIAIYSATGQQLTPYQAHDFIFQRWINQMSDFLVQSYHMPAADANALALGGLDEVLKEYVGGDIVFKQQYEDMALQKYGISLSDAQSIRADYKVGIKGTKCQ